MSVADAFKRLEKAVKSTKDYFECPKEERWQRQLEDAVEVYAANQHALSCLAANEAPIKLEVSIKYLVDHPWAKSALLKVRYAEFLNKDLVAKMVVEANARHTKQNPKDD